MPTGAVTDAINRERKGISMFSGGFVPNFQIGEESRGGGGVAASVAFSFLIPQLTALAEKGNSAAKEVETLTREQAKLEDQLEKVNKDTDPEKFSKLSNELRQVTNAQDQASEAAQKYSNTLTNTLTILNTSSLVIGQLGGQFKKPRSY